MSVTLPAVRAAIRTATVSLPGTCGEWVQGTLDGEPCLVSCPIDWYAQTTVSLEGAHGEWRCPPGAPKAIAALRRVLALLDEPVTGGSLRLANPLPRGRGYASSTADVAGTLFAAGQAAGRVLEPAQVAALAAGIEPSDSTMFPGLTLFAHRDAAFHRTLGLLPPLSLVVLDPGGTVDTVAFNDADRRRALAGLADRHRDAFALFESGLREQDPWAVARAASLSALAHQQILYSELVEAAWAAAGCLGALGICRAHSGTLVGLVCRPGQAADMAKRARARFPGVAVRLHRCLGSREA